MFDFPSQSTEEARGFADTIHELTKDSLPNVLAPMYSASKLSVGKRPLKKKNKPKIIRIIEKSPSEVFALMMDRKRYHFEHDGVRHSAGVGGHRLRCFKKNHICVVCDLAGSCFHLERHRNEHEDQWHWNLYGRNSNGGLVMMTVDHILPRSRGGPDHPDNYQTMCERCNRAKKNDELTNEELRERLNLPPRKKEHSC